MDVTYESWTDTNRLQDPDDLGSRLAAADVGVLVVEADFVFEEVFDAARCLRLVAWPSPTRPAVIRMPWPR